MKEYDYCIIGSGPSGLILSYLLSKKGSVVLIDREKNIGGCHRVRRINGYFTEHGPRIYSSAYVNVKNILDDMGLNFDNYFVDYKFKMSKIGNTTIYNINKRDLLYLVVEFLKLIPSDSVISKNITNSTKKYTCKEFMDKMNFSENTKDYIDRLCRLSDGGGSEKLSMYQLLQILNQNFFYKIKQPNISMDYGLLNDIRIILEKNGVDIITNKKIKSFMNGLDIGDNKIIKGKKYIFCIPPKDYNDIFNMNILENNYYNEYISFSIYWKNKIDIKNWGFPLSDWGIAYINLSDYIKKGINKETVLSCCITKINTQSNTTGKIALYTEPKELIQEVLKQLNEHIEFDEPDKILISPGNKFIKGKWETIDNAYVDGKGYEDNYYGPNTFLENVYSVGTHNGNSNYNFTSMESAVENAIHFYNELYPNDIIEIKNRITISSVVKKILFIIVVIVAICVLYSLFY